MIRIAVTGGTGYVGRAVLAALRGQESVEVRALTRTDEQVTGADVIVGDLQDEDTCRRLVEGVDAVIHAAGLIRSSDKVALARINVDATGLLASAARRAGVRRFVHLSSAGVYGMPGTPVDETTPPRPTVPYERSKLASERVVREGVGDRTVIVRPGVVLGPGHPSEPLRRLLTRVRRGALIVHGGAWTNYVAVDDVARVVVAAAASAQPPPTVVVNAPLPIGAFLAQAGTAVGAAPRTLRIPWPIDPLARVGLRAIGGRFEFVERARALFDTTRFLTVHADWLEAEGGQPTLDGVLRDLALSYGLRSRP